MNVPSFHRSIEYTYKYEHILCSGMRSACYFDIQRSFLLLQYVSSSLFESDFDERQN